MKTESRMQKTVRAATRSIVGNTVEGDSRAFERKVTNTLASALSCVEQASYAAFTTGNLAAHAEGRLISAIGELRKEHGHYTLQNPRDIALITDNDDAG